MNNQMIRELTTTEIEQVSGAASTVGIGYSFSVGFAASVGLATPFGDITPSIGGGFQSVGEIGLRIPSLADLLGDL